VSSNITATGSVTGHVIPELALGVSAFNNKLSATVYLDLDASVKAEIVLNAGVKVVDTGKADPTTSAGVNGQFDIVAGVAAHLGVQGNLFQIIKASKVVDIFAKNWTLYKKGFSKGTAPPPKAEPPKEEPKPAAKPARALASLPHGMVVKRGSATLTGTVAHPKLVCPAGKPGPIQRVISLTAKAAQYVLVRHYNAEDTDARSQDHR
jgi:hypothetical protein